MDEFVRVTAASGAGRIHPRAKYRVDAKVIIDLDFFRLILYRLFVLKAQEWSWLDGEEGGGGGGGSKVTEFEKVVWDASVPKNNERWRQIPPLWRVVEQFHVDEPIENGGGWIQLIFVADRPVVESFRPAEIWWIGCRIVGHFRGGGKI